MDTRRPPSPRSRRAACAFALVALAGCTAPRPGDSAGDTAGDAGDRAAPCPDGAWRVQHGVICHEGAPVRPVGANAMHVFGPGSADMAAWGMGIAREFIGNVRDAPIDGGPIQDANGAWLHPLRDVVADNRANGLVTVLAPMGWDGTEMLYGDDPGRAPYYADYLERLGTIAAAFAGERDVWIALWNEPYAWTGEGFDPDAWLRDQQALLDVVRATGNDSIALVPGSHMGQGAEVWTTHGAALEDPANAVVFDLHAYERWLLDRTPETAAADLADLDDAGLAWMVGEVAPMNAGELMDPRPFLALPEVSARPVTGWLWKYSDTDPDAILDSAGAPNDRDNHAWGSTVRALAAAGR
jgi:mannan endo-1,4-beta-mannosidase